MKNIFFIISLVFFSACNICDNSEYGKEYVFSKENVINNVPDSWANSIVADIKLETSDSLYIDPYFKIIINDSNVYAFYNGPIYHFNIDGTFIKKFGRIGHAEDEYIQLNDVCLNPDAREINVMTSSGILKKFDYDGNYKSTQKIGLGVRSLFYEDGRYWLSTGANDYYSGCEVFMANEKFEIEKEFIKRGFTIPNANHTFSQSPIKTYHFYFSNDVYHIENDTVILAYKFKFPGLEIPELFQHGTMEEYAEKYETFNCATIWNYLESEQYMYLLVDEYVDTKHVLYHWIIDKINNEELIINLGDGDELMESYHSYPQMLTEKNVLYFLGKKDCKSNDESVHIIGVDLTKLFK